MGAGDDLFRSLQRGVAGAAESRRDLPGARADRDDQETSDPGRASLTGYECTSRSLTERRRSEDRPRSSNWAMSDRLITPMSLPSRLVHMMRDFW